MRPRLPRLALLLAACLSAALVLPRPASAIPRAWTNPLGGNAGTAANWSPAGVPQNADDLSFALATVFGVAFDASADTSHSLNFNAGTVTLAITGEHVDTGALDIAHSGTDSAAVIITSGALRVKQNTAVGIGLHGSLLVQGETSRFSGEGSFTSAGAVGSFGRLRVLDGARLETGGLTTLGVSTNLIVGGAGVTTHLPATLATGGSLLMQGGQFRVASGGLVHAGGRLGLANGFFDGNVTAQVDSGGRIEVLDDLLVLHDTSFGTVPDTLRIAKGARVTVADSTVLGVGDSFRPFNGVLQIPTGGVLDTRSFVRSTQGTLLLQGGQLVVRGGIYDEPTKTLLISHPDTSRIELRDGATMTLTAASSGANALELRGGALRVATGAHVTVTQGIVKTNQFGPGLLQVDSSGVFTTSGAISAAAGGAFDPMRLEVTNGGTLTSGSIDVQSPIYPDPSQARIFIDGAGSAIHTGNCLLTANQFATSSPLDLTLDHGGVLDGAVFAPALLRLGTRTNVYVGANAKLGRFASIQDQCRVTLAGGTIEAGAFFQSNIDTATVHGFGTIDAIVYQPTLAGRYEAAGGTLTMGLATDTAGVFVRGTTDVGSATLALLDADAAIAGHLVTLGGGTLSTTHGLRVLAGDSLSGNGAISGAVLNEGVIAPSGGGLSFSGAVSGLGTYAGDKLTFLSGSSFTVAGVVNAGVVSNAGSVITATGDIDMGLAAGTGVNLAGDLILGPNTLHPHGTCVLGSTSLAGGAVLATTAISSNGTLFGRGTVQVSTNLVQFGGVISPGDSIGRLNVTGNMQLRNSGVLFVQLGNHAAGHWDTLAVSGQFSIVSGSLRVRFAPDFVFGTADTFVVVTTNLRGGAFNVIDAPPLPAGWTLQVLHGTKTISIVIALDPLLVGVDPQHAPERLAFAAAHDGRALQLALPQASDADIALYDAAGRRVSILARGAYAAGTHTLPVRSESLPQGLYFARALVTVEGRRTALTARVLVLH